MKVELPVVELKKALPGLGRICGTRGTLPVLGCVKVSCERNGGTIVQAANLEDYAMVKLERCTVVEAGETLVPYDELNKIVKGCGKEESIQIHGSSQQTIIRQAVGGSFVDQKLNHLSMEEWPELPSLDIPMTSLDQRFQEAFRSAYDCASVDASRYVLNGVYLDAEDKKAHYVVATDGHHLFSANSFVFDLPSSILLPTRKFLSWKGFLEDGQWRIGLKPEVREKNQVKEPGWIKVQSKDWTFVTKTIDGSFPNWKQVVPNPARAKTVVSLPPEPVSLLLDVVLKIPVLNPTHQSVVLEVNGRNFAVKGRNSEEEKWTVIPVEGAEVTGKPVTVQLNRNYFLKALRFGLTDIELTTPLEPVVFTGMGKKMVVMPVKPEAEKEASLPKPIQPAPVAASSTQVEPPLEENRTVVKTVSRMEQSSERTETKSAFEQLEGQIEEIRTKLKSVVVDLNEVLKTVARAGKEKRATERECKSIRGSLQEIQRIKI